METVAPESLWLFFLQDNVAKAAESWPYSRFFAFLNAEDYESFRVLNRKGGINASMDVELGGYCDDGYATFTYRLYSTELDEQEKATLLKAVKAAYPEADQHTLKQIASLLGRSDLLKKL